MFGITAFRNKKEEKVLSYGEKDNHSKFLDSEEKVYHYVHWDKTEFSLYLGMMPDTLRMAVEGLKTFQSLSARPVHFQFWDVWCCF